MVVAGVVRRRGRAAAVVLGHGSRCWRSASASARRAGPGRRPGVVRLCLLGHPLRDRAQPRRPPSRPRTSDRSPRLGGCRSAVRGRGRVLVGLGLFRLALGLPGALPRLVLGLVLGAVVVVGATVSGLLACSACCSGRPPSCCSSSVRVRRRGAWHQGHPTDYVRHGDFRHRSDLASGDARSSTCSADTGGHGADPL